MSEKCYIVLPDDYKGYSMDHFCVPKHYVEALECILIPSGVVQDRVERLARDIAEEFGNESMVVLCVLKGGYKFFTDLVDKLKVFNRYIGDRSIQLGMDFIRLKSYKDDESSGTVEVIGGDRLERLKGKNVLVVEDVIDTGNTIKRLLELLKAAQPNKVRVASLLVKRTKGLEYRPDYCGFEVPGRMFVVGYAIDYNDHFRDLNHICVVNEYGKKKFGSERDDDENGQ